MAGLEWLATSGVIAASIVLIGVLAVWMMLKEKRSGLPVADERTQVLGGRAAIRALGIGWVFIIAILAWGIVAKDLLGMPRSDFGEDYYAFSMIAVLLIQGLSFAGFHWYLGRKGEQ